MAFGLYFITIFHHWSFQENPKIFSVIKIHFLRAKFAKIQKLDIFKMSKNENLKYFSLKKSKKSEKMKWDHNALNCILQFSLPYHKNFSKNWKNLVKFGDFYLSKNVKRFFWQEWDKIICYWLSFNNWRIKFSNDCGFFFVKKMLNFWKMSKNEKKWKFAP